MNARAMRWAAWLLLVMGIGLKVSGCGGGSSVGGGGAGNPAIASASIGPNGGNITSLDGKVTLTIPAGALGNTQTITIESIDPATLPAEFAGIAAERAYELKPDGLQFNPPAQIRLQLDAPAQPAAGAVEKGIAVLLTSANGQVEPLGKLALTIDADGKTASLTGELTHFSKLVQAATVRDIVTVSGFPEGPIPVGGTFQVKVSVNHQAESDLRATRVIYVNESLNKVLSITDDSAARLNLDIDTFKKGISLGGLILGERRTLEDSFSYTCTQAGLGFYNVEVRFEELAANGLYTPVNQNQSYVLQFKKVVICQGPDTASGKTSSTNVNGNFEFTVNPPVVIQQVGETFTLTLGEEFINYDPVVVSIIEEIEIFIYDSNLGIVSAPALGDPRAPQGTPNLQLRTEAVFSQLRVLGPHNGKNVQNLKYKCEKTGNTILGFQMVAHNPPGEGNNIPVHFLTVQIECKAAEGKKTGFFMPHDPTPTKAVAWVAFNEGTGHTDGPFSLPGAPNPNNLTVLVPQELPSGAFWEVSNANCAYVHLAGSFQGHSADEDPCKHGGLLFLFERPDLEEPPPSGAVAWKVVNPEIGHEDGPFALPGAPNPDGLLVLDPLTDLSDAVWAEPDDCSFVHLHLPFQNHPDPAPNLDVNPQSACGHGGLVYLF
ncbi:MAG: hypothetical protein MCM46_05655 [Candidatus Manganitrophus sp. SB1]|nr:hypothetical protein [Candidatus Manganitrophus morganii]